jgi:SNF2 family DNA or RNA helicase
MATKRFKAAIRLNGKNKIVTSGTPIENNLGELWSVFRFINPGLLGSISQFNKRFAGPIEKNSDVQAQKQLKKIVSPFILRRLKTQVLDELPSRTEVNLQVQLSDEEKTLYESYRRAALDHITKSSSPKHQRHIKILAEIMKLRRLCCNPSLIAPELNLASSKLTVFDSILTDLLDGGHKVLVFSQFVDHLKIIRNHIESRRIEYQYLDGSTSTAQRRIRVNAFQAGEGEVFLISLRAGGLGLNLTAANYVIHMDPWWNPAVEDQASDRVHRIGQNLPVTIYRLITQDTIEEKIVQLHQHKRELAENLLKGTEFSNKISSDELIAILCHENP